MIRTQIYLPEELHRELHLTARQQRTTLSELVRKGAQKVIADKQKNDESWKVLEKIAAYNWKGPKDLSRRHTEYYVEAVLGKRKRAKKTSR